MNEAQREEPQPVERLEILQFRIMGTRMGVDTEEISEVVAVEQARERPLLLFAFHEMVPFRSHPVTYKAPKALLVKGSTPRAAVIVENPEDIVTIPTERIRPLPDMVERSLRCSVFWGVVLEGNDLILLADFQKLCAAASLDRKGREPVGAAPADPGAHSR